MDNKRHCLMDVNIPDLCGECLGLICKDGRDSLLWSCSPRQISLGRVNTNMGLPASEKDLMK